MRDAHEWGIQAAGKVYTRGLELLVEQSWRRPSLFITWVGHPPFGDS
jgi:hypothetical protein